jgi:hypothetical protein
MTRERAGGPIDRFCSNAGVSAPVAGLTRDNHTSEIGAT